VGKITFGTTTLRYKCHDGEDARCRSAFPPLNCVSDATSKWRTEVSKSQPPPPPPQIPKPLQNLAKINLIVKTVKIAEFRTPTHQDVRKKGSKILKLPTVRNCFTLAVTDKFVVITNSLKVPKMYKMLIYEMKFLVPNYSCLQNL